MSVPFISATFVVAVLGAGLMGYAIQSGATCTVYAVSELIEQRRATRLIAMLEAGLWVALVLTVAGVLHWPRTVPPAYSVSAATVAGGILLGLGATVNGACVFGSVARIGSGELGFAATPLGYWAGVIGHDRLIGQAEAGASQGAAALHLPAIVILAFGAYAVFRALRTIHWTLTRPRTDSQPHLWHPYEATLVIGVTFAILMIVAGAWTYTDALADLARGMSPAVGWRLILFLVLLGGARLAGRRNGRSEWIAPGAGRVISSLGGGALMGLGGALIPGGNDGLVLVGLPYLMPYALVALASMALTIAVALGLGRRLTRKP